MLVACGASISASVRAFVAAPRHAIKATCRRHVPAVARRIRAGRRAGACKRRFAVTENKVPARRLPVRSVEPDPAEGSRRAEICVPVRSSRQVPRRRVFFWRAVGGRRVFMPRERAVRAAGCHDKEQVGMAGVAKLGFGALAADQGQLGIQSLRHARGVGHELTCIQSGVQPGSDAHCAVPVNCGARVVPPAWTCSKAVLPA